MGYKIVYGEGPQEQQNSVNGGINLRIMTAVFLLIFCLLVRIVWPAGTALLRDAVLPGEAGVTELAIESMMAQLRSGASVGEAVTVFCKEVIRNGTNITK